MNGRARRWVLGVALSLLGATVAPPAAQAQPAAEPELAGQGAAPQPAPSATSWTFEQNDG